jgi:CRISPR/Cas system endoribonuclease Cas6 (RAMP superfamily)
MLWLLAKYGEYSGVGIKNAIGMGAINVKNEKRENKK